MHARYQQEIFNKTSMFIRLGSCKKYRLESKNPIVRKQRKSALGDYEKASSLIRGQQFYFLRYEKIDGFTLAYDGSEWGVSKRIITMKS